MKQSVKVLLVLLAIVAMFSIRMAFAQDVMPAHEAEAPSIDQIVSGIMQMFGTWVIAYLVNIARTKWNVIPGSWMLVVVVNVLGLAVSALQSWLQIPGHSWILSFFATFGSVFISQLIAQSNRVTGSAQYQLSSIPIVQKLLGNSGT
jgi:hypothetical protein